MHKLAAYGIKGSIQRWISAFLNDRSQIVVVNGVESKSAAVLSGIPQGSVLGPLLFVIYINDLPKYVDSDVFLFADDKKKYCARFHQKMMLLRYNVTLILWSDGLTIGY